MVALILATVDPSVVLVVGSQLLQDFYVAHIETEPFFAAMDLQTLSLVVARGRALSNFLKVIVEIRLIEQIRSNSLDYDLRLLLLYLWRDFLLGLS